MSYYLKARIILYYHTGLFKLIGAFVQTEKPTRGTMADIHILLQKLRNNLQELQYI